MQEHASAVTREQFGAAAIMECASRSVQISSTVDIAAGCGDNAGGSSRKMGMMRESCEFGAGFHSIATSLQLTTMLELPHTS